MKNHENSGNINSITELYEAYHRPIFGYLLRLTGSRQAAEEMTQETFYRALLAVPRFKGTSKVSTWLFKIARHVYLNEIRERSRRGKLERRIIDYGTAGSPEGLPEQALEQVLLGERIEHALRGLPEQYVTVILLKEVAELSYPEIAQIMDKSVSSAQVLLYRAKQRFQEEYKRLEEDMS